MYTNAVAISYATNYSYTVAYSNVVTAAIFTNTVPTYISPTEELVFTGTAATNGWLRLVLE